MRDFRLAAVSMNGRLGEPAVILDEIADWTRQACDQGAELILFPELVVHGHCTPATYDLAEAVPDGPSTRRLCAIAAEYGATLCVGLSEKENDLVFNARVLVIVQISVPAESRPRNIRLPPGAQARLRPALTGQPRNRQRSSPTGGYFPTARPSSPDHDTHRAKPSHPHLHRANAAPNLRLNSRQVHLTMANRFGCIVLY